MTVSTVAVCCDDLGLLSDARRLCAVAGLEAEVTSSLDPGRWWRSADVVLLDATAAAQLLTHGVTRRDRVAVLTRAEGVADWRVAVAVGAQQLAVLPTDERVLLDGVLDLQDSSGALVVGCVAATGGAGASTVASALAVAAARQGAATLLIDADPPGGGLDLLFGLEHTPGVRWPDLVDANARSRPDGLPEGLLVAPHGLALLSWDRRAVEPQTATRSFSAMLPAARSAVDLVVVDLPRSTCLDVGAVIDVVLLVVRAAVRPTVAGASMAEQLRSRCRDVRVVVRTAGRAGLSAADVATAVGLPLAAQLTDDKRIAAAADEGQLPRLLSRLAMDALAAELSAVRRAAA